MPNLLNNLLRNIRQKERPTESIEVVAKSMNVDYITGTYLTKIENGDLKKPKEIEPIAKAYSDGAINWLPLLTMVDTYIRSDAANDDPPWPHFKDAYKLFVGSPFSRWVYGTLFDQRMIDSRGTSLVSIDFNRFEVEISKDTIPYTRITSSAAAELTFGTPCAVSFHEVILLVNPMHAPMITASPEVLAKWHKNFNIAIANPLYDDGTPINNRLPP
jgi:hypothetical protein